MLPIQRAAALFTATSAGALAHADGAVGQTVTAGLIGGTFVGVGVRAAGGLLTKGPVRELDAKLAAGVIDAAQHADLVKGVERPMHVAGAIGTFTGVALAGSAVGGYALSRLDQQ